MKQEIVPMRHRLATLAAMSALALGLSAAPALAGSPAFHYSLPASSPPIVCGAHTYTVVSGTLDVVEHDGSSASGNINSVTIVRANNVVVEDQNGNFYGVVGVEQFKGTLNARTGGSQQMTVFKFQIIGTADSLNVIFRTSPNGGDITFGPGTCSAG